MATYRAFGGSQTAEVSDGSVLGNELLGVGLNGLHLVKGAGAIRLKEVNDDGSPKQGATEHHFKYSETISGLV